jgi:hypothetical protein
MNGVGQQRHRATDDHHNDLRTSCQRQAQQTDLDGPDACRARLQGVIDRVMRVMGVRHQKPVNKTVDSGGVHMTVLVGAIIAHGMTVPVGGPMIVFLCVISLA